VSDLVKDGRIPRPPPPGRPHGHTPHDWSRVHAPENGNVNYKAQAIPEWNMAEGWVHSSRSKALSTYTHFS
jgi:hypothetical protein